MHMIFVLVLLVYARRWRHAKNPYTWEVVPRGVSHLGRVLTIEYPTLRQYKRDSFIRHQAAPVYQTRCASQEIAGRTYLWEA